MTNEDWLDGLLHAAADEALPDAGFSAAVRQRLRGLQALARVQALRQHERLQTRWSLGGAAVGTGLALAIAQGTGLPAVPSPGLWLPWAMPLAALGFGSVVLALLLLHEPRP